MIHVAMRSTELLQVGLVAAKDGAMPTFQFHVVAGREEAQPLLIEASGLEEAKAMGLAFMGELLKDAALSGRDEQRWLVMILDEDGDTLHTIAASQFAAGVVR